MTERARLTILFSAALLLCYLLVQHVEVPGLTETLTWQQQIVTHTVSAPYTERILPYALIEIAAGVFSDHAVGIWLFSVAADAFLLTAYLYASYRFLCHFGRRDMALVFTLFLTLTFNVTLQFVPRALSDSWLEALLYVCAYNLFYRVFERPGATLRHYLMLVALFAIGAMNRDTILALVPVFLLLAWRFERTRIVWTPIFACVGLAAFFAVQSFTGTGVRELTLAVIFGLNLETFGDAVISLTCVLGGVWVLVIRSFRRAPEFLRLCVVGLVPYLVLVVVYGLWQETRLLVPIFPILFAMVISRQPRVNAE